MFRKLLVVSVLAVLPCWVVSAAVTVISEDFQDDALGSTPSSPAVGSWLPGTGVAVLTHGGSKAVEHWNGGGATMNGFIQASAQSATPGDVVHAEFKLQYRDGFDTFGITSNAASNTRAGQVANAVMFLMFQDSTGGPTLGVNAMDSAGNFVKLAGISAYHNPDNPFPPGTFFDTVEMDYVVGDSTGKLTINGTVISNSVPLRNPGAIVDGMFFTDLETGRNNYVFDDLLMTVAPVPEPTSLATACLGGVLLLPRRRRP
jgi:hypothetical protein